MYIHCHIIYSFQINFTDKYPKRICQICLIKLDDIHGFACHAQKNQQILARFRENQLEAEAEAAALAAAAAATKAAVAANRAAQATKTANAKQPRITISLKTQQASGNRAKAVSSSSSNKSVSHKKTILSNSDITIFAYDELKLGQFIKDPDLLTLILKALKWDDLKEDKHSQLERLRKANFQDVLSNPDLLQDEDLMQLLGPYMNREPTLSITRQSANATNNGHGNMDGLRQLNENKNVTEMEVGVDPDLFFPDDDDETRSAEEISPGSSARDDVKPILCIDCPQVFTNQADLFEHNKLKHDTSVRLVGKKKSADRPRKRAKISTPLNLTMAKVIKVNPPPVVIIPVIEVKDDDEEVNEAIDLVSDVEYVPSPEPIVIEDIDSRSPSPIQTAAVEPEKYDKKEEEQPKEEDEESVICSVMVKIEPPEPVARKKSLIALVEAPNTRRRLSNRRLIAEPSTLVRTRTRTRTTMPRFACHHCGRKMNTKGNLKVHLETHKPKGKFNCEKCGRV